MSAAELKVTAYSADEFSVQELAEPHRHLALMLVPHPDSERYARLFAAAPALLEALDALVDWAEDVCAGEPEPGEMFDARAAIKQAGVEL